MKTETENTAKHTPGPWTVPHFADQKCKCDCAYVLCEQYAGSICTVDIDNGKAIGEGGNDAPPLEEAKANAYLIAAAPDLLAALEAIQVILTPSATPLPPNHFGCYLKGEGGRQMSAPEIKLPATLSRHVMTSRPITHKSEDGLPPYVFQNIWLGYGETKIVMVTGTDYTPGETAESMQCGYPEPTIAEAEAIADELIRRWNAQGAAEALVACWLDRAKILHAQGSPGMADALRVIACEARTALGMPTPSGEK